MIGPAEVSATCHGNTEQPRHAAIEMRVPVIGILAIGWNREPVTCFRSSTSGLSFKFNGRFSDQQY